MSFDQQTPCFFRHGSEVNRREDKARCGGLMDDLRCRKRLGDLLRYYYWDAN